MLDRAWIEGRDSVPAGTTGATSTTGTTSTTSTAGTSDDRSAQVVDLQDWRIRRTLVRQRGYARSLCEYVPRHRTDTEALGNGG